MKQEKIKLIVRVTKYCDHDCPICLQFGNHAEAHLAFDKFSQFLPRFREFAYENFDLIEVGITGTGDPIFYPQLNEIIELCYEVLDPSVLLLQTSGPANDVEHNKLTPISEIAWRQQYKKGWDHPVFTICTTLFDDPEAFARFDRLLSVDVPSFGITYVHRPDVKWAHTSEEKTKFHEAISARGFTLAADEVAKGTDMDNALEVFFNRKQVYVNENRYLQTASEYIMPVGKALSLLSAYVPTPVELELKNRKPTLYIGEDANFLACSSSVWGYGDICDDSVGLDSILASTSHVADFCHQAIRDCQPYKDGIAHKCHVCGLTWKDQKAHEILTEIYEQALSTDIANKEAHKNLV